MDETVNHFFLHLLHVHNCQVALSRRCSKTVLFTVYPQYVGIKKPLDGFSHYINIGVRMRERFWLKRYLADVRSP